MSPLFVVSIKSSMQRIPHAPTMLNSFGAVSASYVVWIPTEHIPARAQAKSATAHSQSLYLRVFTGHVVNVEKVSIFHVSV